MNGLPELLYLFLMIILVYYGNFKLTKGYCGVIIIQNSALQASQYSSKIVYMTYISNFSWRSAVLKKVVPALLSRAEVACKEYIIRI